MIDKRLPYIIFNKTFERDEMPYVDAMYRSFFNANGTREECDLVLYHPYENKWYYRDEIGGSDEHDEPPTPQYFKVLHQFIMKD